MSNFNRSRTDLVFVVVMKVNIGPGTYVQVEELKEIGIPLVSRKTLVSAILELKEPTGNLPLRIEIVFLCAVR